MGRIGKRRGIGLRKRKSGKQTVARENLRVEGEQMLLDEAIQEQLEAFRAKFGRDPLPHEPIFFDPEKDVPSPMDPGVAEAEVLEAMKAAGIRPEIIYAYKKTGLLLSEEMRDIYPAEVQEEYQAAIAEYLELEKAGKLSNN